MAYTALAQSGRYHSSNNDSSWFDASDEPAGRTDKVTSQASPLGGVMPRTAARNR